MRHMVHKAYQSEDCPCVEMLALSRFHGFTSFRAVNRRMDKSNITSNRGDWNPEVGTCMNSVCDIDAL